MEFDQGVGEEHSPVKLRSYQQEMWQASVEKNVIVAMDTGSGKTHVAIARMLTALENSDSSKLVWFLSPSVALSAQQASVLSANLPAYPVRSLTGNDGVDKWTDQALWDAALASVRVVVGTPAVLADALTHGFISLSRLALLVFDEAHRASKGHPMNAIMQNFYHVAKQSSSKVPAILGLTASPVMSTKQGSLEQIERNLDSVAVTPKEHRIELESFVNPPKVEIITYQNNALDEMETSDPLCNALSHAVQSYNLNTDPYVLDLKRRDDSKALDKVFLTRKTYANDQLRALDLRASTISTQIGSSIARWYIQSCLKNFREGLRSMTDTTVFMPDLSTNERNHLSNIFDAIERNADQQRSSIPVSRCGLTDKAEKLVQVLTSYADESLRGIVFVEQRVHVTALSYLLAQLPEITKTYRMASFVGTSASTHRKISVADLVTTKEQQKDLDAFRNGEKNLMIATNVLEEGIDVAACNFVVCFDPPKNLVSFVQRRGRARQKKSKYFLFASQDEISKSGKDWESLEARMKEAYMDESRQVTDHTEDDELNELSYRVVSTGAFLTSENAKSHLYHFCSVGTSQASNYVDLRPEFDTEEVVAGAQWIATVDLPTFVHPNVRHATSSRTWASEAAAIKDAAFQAYVALHKEGLINDNLLPLIKDYGPKPGQQHLDQPSLIQVSERELSWKHLWRDADLDAVMWNSYSVEINLRGQQIVNLMMWTPCDMPMLEPFELFWNEHDTYNTAIQPSTQRSNNLSHAERSILSRCTDMLLRIIHGNRMPEPEVDCPVLLSPGSLIFSEQWIDLCNGKATTASLDGQDPLSQGLVNVKGLMNQSFFFHGFQTTQNDDGAVVKEAVLTSFPKRRDFLHQVPESNTAAAAYTTKRAVPVDDCTVGSLPAKYGILSAFLPSMLHRVDTALLASRLQCGLLEPVGLQNANLVLEAISAPSSNEQEDYNRLEFLGDTILKHSTELQVMAQHTNWPEAYLTMERDRIVRNDNLAQAALRAGLDKFILTKPFTGNKWRPPSVSEILQRERSTRQMSTKTLADVVEALIGAAYVDGGLSKAQTCIAALLPTEIWHPSEDYFDMLLQDLNSTSYKDLEVLQRLVGHDFAHPTLLVEALTHVSFPYNMTGLSYERLEFLGDSVLDMIITPKLFAHPRKLKHWQLHRYHEALVNSHFLGFCCLNYAIEEEMSDVKKDGPQYVATRTKREAQLHDFLRAGHQVMVPRQKAIQSFQVLRDTITSALQHDQEYPWSDLMALNLPKFFCDIVESVLGALFIDTRGDFTVCEAFVEKLSILDIMRRLLDDEVECINPKERLGMVADRDEVRYVNSKDADGKLQCVVRVGDEEIVTVAGCASKEEAEVKAAHRACEILEARAGYHERAKRRKLNVVRVDEAMDLDDDDE